ncbi:hypothetical protein HT576_09015 [Haloterrigena sp. SYSU A121-1]|uniref:Uncharacterized protein n=1 Tax=Haloterrigena gelatinilytica TaxID=2741724 RepID=A0A8J8GPH0_9EURY|nr:hypothetical protein [Haloterrigena gelatinilytica]NUB91160.1 hypothetical protein [Haloterrigena gelatinilytica]
MITIDLTTPRGHATRLEEVEVMGRTVYLNKKDETAYVEFGDELVSMTNLRAWNHLIEQAKVQNIDGYEEEKSLDEKQIERKKEAFNDKIESFMRELNQLRYEVREIAESEKGEEK